MRINNNIEAITTRNSLFAVNRDICKSLHKLSTGLRINSAADDAAGLGVSENLRTQVRGMGQALKNTQDAIALLTIADGALNEQAAILQRMRELVIQAKNDTYTQTERNYMGKEFSHLMNELDRIAATTKYNGMTLFAVPERYGSSTGIYPSNTVPEPLTAHKAGQSVDLGNGGALHDPNDLGSSHHFNMLIGQNYSARDAAAFVATSKTGSPIEYYTPSAENMLTIALGQMDSNALFHISPVSASLDPNPQVHAGGWGIFGDFSWNPGMVDPLTPNDAGDNLIDLAAGGGEIFGTGTVSYKLDLILRVIDGGKDLTLLEQGIIFGNAGAQSPTGFDRINKMRANIGALLNRLEHTVNNLMNQQTNTQAAESVVRDADFAKETMEFTRNQILTRSSTVMLAQANIKPQMVLQLLR